MITKIRNYWKNVYFHTFSKLCQFFLSCKQLPTNRISSEHFTLSKKTIWKNKIKPKSKKSQFSATSGLTSHNILSGKRLVPSSRIFTKYHHFRKNAIFGALGTETGIGTLKVVCYPSWLSRQKVDRNFRAKGSGHAIVPLLEEKRANFEWIAL